MKGNEKHLKQRTKVTLHIDLSRVVAAVEMGHIFLVIAS